MSAPILYVDDDRPNLDLFRRNFEDTFELELAASADEALALLAERTFGLVVSDQRMPGQSGIELLRTVRERWPDTSRILLTAYSDRDLLLAAIHEGHVHDYVLKPWDADDLELRLRSALDAFTRVSALRRASTVAEALRDELGAELAERGGYGDLVGFDGDLAPVAARLAKIATSDSTVMLRGETGTGKELIARELHRRSPRRAGPFVRVNCCALAEGLLESELFGHEPGAFTGATKRRIGRFEQADGGTLFLDEIGDLPSHLQVKLLRVLEERELERVGGSETIRVDVRIIAATHRDLEERVQAEVFRQDLYHRLNVVPLVLPPLRERRRDIGLLARHFVAGFGAARGTQVDLGDDAIAQLEGYDWPGNVRELRNVVERAMVLADDGYVLRADDLIFDFARAATPTTDAPPRRSPPTDAPSPDDGPATSSVFAEIERVEADRIRDALRAARGSKARAARILGIPRTTLNDRIKKLEIR